MKSPCISIIIPTFNSAKTLRRSLLSVLRQTYENIEILIVDGGSIDQTNDIIKELSQKDSRIKWISEKDQGTYDAMNKGIKFATGDWLYFLGSDDYLMDDQVFIDIVSAILMHKHVDFMYGDVKSPVLSDKYDGEFDFNKLKTKNICHQSIFYKRNLFLKLGYFNLKYKSLADWEFNLKCFLSPEITTQYIDRMIAYFSEGGISNSQEDSYFFEDMSSIVAINGYKKLPLKELKYHCSSNKQFFSLLLKRYLA